jgi:hypothetical protein
LDFPRDAALGFEAFARYAGLGSIERFALSKGLPQHSKITGLDRAVTPL